MRRTLLRAGLSAAAAGLAAACAAPAVQLRGLTTPDFPGARLDLASAQPALVAADGARLPLQVWLPAEHGWTGETWAAVVALHGFNDYANAFIDAGPAWAARGIAVYAYDQRGFGRTAQRGVWGGAELMQEDLRTAAALVRARHPGAVTAIVGESMGGAVAVSAFASAEPPDADRLVLLAPAVWGWSSQPPLNAAALWVGARTFGSYALTPPPFVTRKIRASDNTEELLRMGRDPQMIWRTRIDSIYGLVGLMQRASLDLAGLRVPTLYGYGAHDQIIPRRPTREALARLPAAARTAPIRTAWYADGWHLLTRDLQRERVFADAVAFLHDPAAPLPSAAPAIPLTRAGMRALTPQPRLRQAAAPG